MEGWNQKQQSLDKDKEPTNLMEGSEEQDYEISITERVQKRKGGSEDTEIKQKKPKRIKLDKLEGWGESITTDTVEEILPEGWWQGGVNVENNNGEHKRALSPQSDVKSKKKFKFKKNGRINKAEEKELKRTCTSLRKWIQVPALPPPTPSTPTMNDAQEETEDMEWEGMGREEKLERARRKKEGRDVFRFVKGIILESSTLIC